MKKLFMIFAILLVLSIFFASINMPETIVVNEINNNQTIIMDNNDILVVELESNPSTGYDWKEVAWTCVTPRSKHFIQNSDVNIVGGIGKTRMIFNNATKNCMGNLLLGYMHPWESGEQSIKSYTITIVVE